MISKFRAQAGFTSADFPGVSPRTRFGSFVNTPGYVMPNPEMVYSNRMASWFLPRPQGLLRLPQLFVRGPNQLSLGVNSQMTTPVLRKMPTGSVTY